MSQTPSFFLPNLLCISSSVPTLYFGTLRTCILAYSSAWSNALKNFSAASGVSILIPAKILDVAIFIISSPFKSLPTPLLCLVSLFCQISRALSIPYYISYIVFFDSSTNCHDQHPGRDCPICAPRSASKTEHREGTEFRSLPEEWFFCFQAAMPCGEITPRCTSSPCGSACRSASSRSPR